MGSISKSFLLLSLLAALVLLVSSQVAARDLAQTTTQMNIGDEATEITEAELGEDKHPYGRRGGGYGGGSGSYGGRGGYGGGYGGNGYRHGGYGGNGKGHGGYGGGHTRNGKGHGGYGGGYGGNGNGHGGYVGGGGGYRGGNQEEAAVINNGD